LIPLFLLSIALGSSAAFAQAAALAGRVTDAQGAPVAAVDLRLAREDRGLSRSARTTDAGDYRFEGLPPGVFVLEVSKEGFRRRVNVVTVARDPIALDLRLDVAGVDEEVVVTAAGLPQVTDEISKPLTTIDAREIQDRNETTLSEIVRFAPGVQIRSGGGPGQFAQMRIRGLRADASAVLVDGLRFRDASTPQSDATSFLSNLNFVAADRVEVLRGSGSSLYGTNAVGGVVNLVTRDGGGPLRLDAQAEGGSLGWLRARAGVSGGALEDRLAFSVGALQFNLRDGLDGNDATRSTGGQAAFRYQLTPRASVSVRFFGSDDDVQLNVGPTATGIPAANIPNTTIVDAIPVTPSEIERANAGLTPVVGAATYLPGRDDPDSRRNSSFYSTAAIFRHQTTATFRWQASYQRVHTDRVFRNGPKGAGFQPSADNYGNYAGSVDTLDARGFLRPNPWLTLSAGYELEREGYFDRQDNNLPAPRRVQTESRIAQQAHAGFGAAQLALLDRRLQVSVSGRAQAFRIARPQLAATGTPNVYQRIALAPPPRALTGDVSVAYVIARSSTKLRAHGGNAYRAPSLYERFGGGFSNDPVTGARVFTPYGDPRLEPDRYRSLDAGIDQHLFASRVLVAVTAFHTRVVSITAFDSTGGVRPDTDPFGRSAGYVNGSGGFSRGLELGVDSRPSAAWRLAASYTFTDAQMDRDITVPGFFKVLAVSRHTATLVVSGRLSRRLDATLDAFRGSEAFGAFFAAGRPRAYRFPGFTKVAAVARYRVASAGGQPLRAYVKVDNLLDQTYYDAGWRALGRSVVAGVSVGE
jgi:iron complex outermembrane receptor protein